MAATRTNRQQVLNLSGDGGAHAHYEYDATAEGSYAAPDPRQPAAYDLARSTDYQLPQLGAGGMYATPGFGDVGETPVPIIMMNPAFGNGGGGQDPGEFAPSLSANASDAKKKARIDRKVHVGLAVGLAVAFAIARSTRRHSH